MQRIKSFSIRKLAVVGMLGAISMVLGLTPLGFIPVGPTRATIMHIPVIIGAIVEGPVVGVLVGIIFGIFSMFQAITNPTPVSFVFLNPLVSILPRILIGITAYYSYEAFKKIGRKTSVFTLIIIWLSSLAYLVNKFYTDIKIDEISTATKTIEGLLIIFILILGIYSYRKFKDQALEVVVSAAIGTLTNTVGVLFMIYFIYASDFVEKLGYSTSTAGKVILGIGITNGIPEIIVAMLIVTGVVMGLKNKK